MKVSYNEVLEKVEDMSEDSIKSLLSRLQASDAISSIDETIEVFRTAIENDFISLDDLY